MMTIPHAKNFCGGNFQDWLEVNLTEKCNAKCSWCIERGGYHPEYHAPWFDLVNTIIESGKQNIILLGGEPTLYRDIRSLINSLYAYDKNVYITTNGSVLSSRYVRQKLFGLTGINISIHHYNVNHNRVITGLYLEWEILKRAIVQLQDYNISVRFNCNIIKDHIDSYEEIIKYIEFAKEMGAEKIRFAELKMDTGRFIDLAKILNHKYGLNDNPFIYGCHSDAVIKNMPVNFRQMCGLQTGQRKPISNPQQASKQVLYYDGKMYDNWQLEKEITMNKKELTKILKEVAEGKKTPEDAAKEIKEKTTEESSDSGAGCRY